MKPDGILTLTRSVHEFSHGCVCALCDHRVVSYADMNSGNGSSLNFRRPREPAWTQCTGMFPDAKDDHVSLPGMSHPGEVDGQGKVSSALWCGHDYGSDILPSRGIEFRMLCRVRTTRIFRASRATLSRSRQSWNPASARTRTNKWMRMLETWSVVRRDDKYKDAQEFQ